MRIVDGPAPGEAENNLARLRDMPPGIVFAGATGEPCIKIKNHDSLIAFNLVSGNHYYAKDADDKYEILPAAILYTGRNR